MYFSGVEWGEYENSYNITSDGDELDISDSNLTVEISDSNVLHNKTSRMSY